MHKINKHGYKQNKCYLKTNQHGYKQNRRYLKTNQHGYKQNAMMRAQRKQSTDSDTLPILPLTFTQNVFRVLCPWV